MNRVGPGETLIGAHSDAGVHKRSFYLGIVAKDSSNHVVAGSL